MTDEPGSAASRFASPRGAAQYGPHKLGNPTSIPDPRHPRRVASTPQQRALGLMFRTAMPARTLLFVLEKTATMLRFATPCPSVDRLPRDEAHRHLDDMSRRRLLALLCQAFASPRYERGCSPSAASIRASACRRPVRTRAGDRRRRSRPAAGGSRSSWGRTNLRANLLTPSHSAAGCGID